MLVAANGTVVTDSSGTIEQFGNFSGYGSAFRHDPPRTRLEDNIPPTAIRPAVIYCFYRLGIAKTGCILKKSTMPRR